MAGDSRIKFSALGARLQAPAISALMHAALEDEQLLSLAAGFTDTATLPRREVGQAVRELEALPGLPEHLQYGTTVGRPRLREILAARTAAQDGLPAGAVPAARTIIGNGSQQLLHLAIEVLCDPGDIVLVEQPSYFVFLEMLAGLGVRPVALPCGEDGRWDFPALRSRLGELRRVGDAARVKAVYVMGYFANPSGRSRTEQEKTMLASALRDAGLCVPALEDAAYRDLWFDVPGRERSVLALEAWRDFPRLYLGTLTKPFASGLKVGFAHATDADWFDRIAWLKGHQDFGTANLNQAVLETVLVDGGLDAHLERLRPAYAEKMRRLHAALQHAGLRELGWEWSQPHGGLYLWLRAPAGLDTAIGGPFWSAALAERVLYVPGSLCQAEATERAFVRLSFGVLNGAALDEAAARFGRAAARVAAGATAASR